MKRLLIYEPSYRRVESRVADIAGELELLLMDETGAITLNGAPVTPDEAQPDAGWASADVFFGAAGRHYMIALLKSARLAWVQSAAAGFDNPVFRQFVEKGVQLTTSHGQAVGMAEYVIAGVLDHFQRGPERRAAQAEGEWRRLAFTEVMGTTWLIIGFGAIGQGVAQRAKAFGARTIGVRRDQTPHPLADQLASLETFRGHLPLADVVVLSVPLSPATAIRRRSSVPGAWGARVTSVRFLPSPSSKGRLPTTSTRLCHQGPSACRTNSSRSSSCSKVPTRGC